MSQIPEVCPHFHLSLQSGCDQTLRRMNRHYSADEYEAGVKMILLYFKVLCVINFLHNGTNLHNFHVLLSRYYSNISKKKKQPFLYFISVSQVFPAVLLIHAKQDFICQMPLNLHGCDRVAAFLCIRLSQLISLSGFRRRQKKNLKQPVHLQEGSHLHRSMYLNIHVVRGQWQTQ